MCNIWLVTCIFGILSAQLEQHIMPDYICINVTESHFNIYIC